MRRMWERQDGEDGDGDRVEVTGLLLIAHHSGEVK